MSIILCIERYLISLYYTAMGNPGPANGLESTRDDGHWGAVQVQKDPSQGTLGRSTCGPGQGQARKTLVPCLMGKCSLRGHRSLAGMAASLVLG